MPELTHLTGPTTARPPVSHPVRRTDRARSGLLSAGVVLSAVAMVVALGLLPSSAAAQAVQGEACAPGEGVTVVVDFTALDDVRIGCAPGQQASGFAALQAAGFTVGTQAGPGIVCTIDGLPSEGYPYCWSTGGYWSYWKKARGGSWGFSGSGPGGGPLPIDSVEGWSWAQGFSSAAPRADETTAPTTTTTAPPQTTTAPATSTSTTGASTTTTSGSLGPTSTSTVTSGPSSSTVPGPPPSPSAPSTVVPPPSGGVRPAGVAAARPGAPLARTGGPIEAAALAGAAVLLAGSAASASARRLERHRA